MYDIPTAIALNEKIRANAWNLDKNHYDNGNDITILSDIIEALIDRIKNMEKQITDRDALNLRILELEEELKEIRLSMRAMN